MTNASGPPTATDLVAASSGVLESGGYLAIRIGFPDWNTSSTRLFEDEYGIVGLAVFQTCGELIRSWADLQGSLVDVISNRVGRAEGKAWDGYLVLLTPGVAPSGDFEMDRIRGDTGRLRKLVGTGDDLLDAGDVRRTLLPLLPLHVDTSGVSRGSALDLLPHLLEDRGVDRETTAALVRAFLEQKPLLESLHVARGPQ